MAAAQIAKGFSDLLKLDIVLDRQQQGASNKILPELDLDSLHKYSLHWVSTDGKVPANTSSGSTGITQPMKQLSVKTVQTGVSTATDSTTIKVSVKTLTGKTTPITINSQSTITELKDAIREANGLQNEGIKVLYHNKKLEDQSTLSKSNITDGVTLFMIVTMESIAPSFFMNAQTFLDPGYDYQYGATDGANAFIRGNRRFIRPCGWTKRALFVLGKYENDIWLGSSSAAGEWPVAYHGTKKETAEAFCKRGGVLRSRGKKYTSGKGIYTTPSPALAEQQTDSFEFGGLKYKMIFMDRVSMDHTVEYDLSGIGGGTYFITSDEKVRPYCVLLKQV